MFGFVTEVQLKWYIVHSGQNRSLSQKLQSLSYLSWNIDRKQYSQCYKSCKICGNHLLCMRIILTWKVCSKQLYKICNRLVTKRVAPDSHSNHLFPFVFCFQTRYNCSLYSFLALQTFPGELGNPFDQTITSLEFAKSGPKSEEKIVSASN